jgi:peptidoglycan/xylan/chitin deacetylase (PgdA/CDA1 family)
MPLLLGGGLESDIVDGALAIKAATGTDPRPWFRCPFGAGHDDPRVITRLESLGYRNVHWHVELEDWEPWRTGPDIAEDLARGVTQHGDGAVVLLHTWPGGTADALPEALERLGEMGASFVGVDELQEVP